uniref:transposase n=1 Tax=Paracoccus actinidiae TaxID=3064531 RepID=UPI00359C5B74
MGDRWRNERRDVQPLYQNPAGPDAQGRRRCHSGQPFQPQEPCRLYTKTQLVPTLRAGDVVILDNLSSHKSPAAAAALRDVGAWFLFLPPYSPDLNPIEMAFAKLKALIRKAAARTYDQLWAAVGQVCDLFSDEECYNCFKAAGYEVD